MYVMYVVNMYVYATLNYFKRFCQRFFLIQMNKPSSVLLDLISVSFHSQNDKTLEQCTGVQIHMDPIVSMWRQTGVSYSIIIRLMSTYKKVDHAFTNRLHGAQHTNTLFTIEFTENYSSWMYKIIHHGTYTIRFYGTHTAHATHWKMLKHTTVWCRLDLCLPKSPTMAVAVLWCAETSSSSFQEISVASPLVCLTPSSPHTSPLHPLSLATAVVRALQREIKKRLLLSPCRRDGRLFLSFFLLHSLHTHRKGSERGKEKKITAWRKERNLYSYTACCGVPPHR